MCEIKEEILKSYFCSQSNGQKRYQIAFKLFETHMRFSNQGGAQHGDGECDQVRDTRSVSLCSSSASRPGTPGSPGPAACPSTTRTAAASSSRTTRCSHCTPASRTQVRGQGLDTDTGVLRINVYTDDFEEASKEDGMMAQANLKWGSICTVIKSNIKSDNFLNI